MSKSRPQTATSYWEGLIHLRPLEVIGHQAIAIAGIPNDPQHQGLGLFPLIHSATTKVYQAEVNCHTSWHCNDKPYCCDVWPQLVSWKPKHCNSQIFQTYVPLVTIGSNGSRTCFNHLSTETESSHNMISSSVLESATHGSIPLSFYNLHHGKSNMFLLVEFAKHPHEAWEHVGDHEDFWGVDEMVK